MHSDIVKNEHKTSYLRILYISSIVALLSGVLLFINTLGATAPPEFITLSETDKISFKAYLTDSEPFGRPYLDQTSDHIPADILEYIELSANYKAELSSQAVVNFSSSATITVIATQNKGGSGTENNPVILNRTFSLCQDNEYMTNPNTCPDGPSTSAPTEINDTEYSYQRAYKLYLQPYIDYVMSTTESYVAYPIKTSITIDFQTSASNNDQLRSIMKRSVIIPMSDTTFQITLTGNEGQSKDFYALERTSSEIVLLVVFGVLFVSGIGVTLFMAKKILNKKSPYRIEIDGYLSDYADAIVKTITPPELDNHPEHIAVEAFKELLNLAVSISDPIMCYETPTSTIFYITRDSIIYYYIINDPDRHRHKHRRHHEYIEASAQETGQSSYVAAIEPSASVPPENSENEAKPEIVSETIVVETILDEEIPAEVLVELAHDLAPPVAPVEYPQNPVVQPPSQDAKITKIDVSDENPSEPQRAPRKSAKAKSKKAKKSPKKDQKKK